MRLIQTLKFASFVLALTMIFTPIAKAAELEIEPEGPPYIVSPLDQSNLICGEEDQPILVGSFS